MVPSPIAACAERITQMGMWSALGRWNAWIGNATNSAELEARRATMIPIVFWASLVPCPSEYSAADTSCSSRNARSTRRGKERRSTQRSEEHTSELQSQSNLVCRLLLEKKKKTHDRTPATRPLLYRLHLHNKS